MRKENIIVYSLIALFSLSALLLVFQSITENTSLRTFFKPDPLLPKKGIGVIYVYGPIGVSSTPFPQPSSSDHLIEQLKDFEQDTRVRALILRINSPGGTVGSTQEFYRALQKFKARTKIPVIASIAEIGTSGAYWVAAGCDTVFANPGSMVGNIGVLIGNYDVSELASKYGVGFNIYKSGEYKDVLSMWRKSTPGEKQLLNSMVANIYEQFVTVVMEGRHMKRDQAVALSDGRIFTGEQAKEMGLVDQFGGLQEAVDYAKKKAGISGEPEIITKMRHPVFQFLDLVNTSWKNSAQSLLPGPSSFQLR